MNRKSRLRRNLGESTAQDDKRFAEPFFDGPGLAELRTSVVLPERLIRRVLLDEVTRLAAQPDELRRFFSHFFDPTSSEAERDAYVRDFQRNPPLVTMGYPRMGAELPCFAVVLTSDQEADGEAALGNYVGETLEGEQAPGYEDQYYEGAFFDQQNSIYVFAQHPDQTLYLYQLAKLVLLGAREALHNAGMISPSYSGGELSPNEIYLPDSVFSRVLNVSYKVLMTVPKVFTHRDGSRLRMTGIFAEDVVVDGIPGGVTGYSAGENDDG